MLYLSGTAPMPKSSLMYSEDKCRSRSAASLLCCRMFAGKLRAIAVASTARSVELPDVPPIADTLSGFEASGWCGIVAPRTTPVEIVEKLYLEINEGLADPNIAARLADAGVTILALSREEFGKFVINETEKWAKVIRAANLRPD
jgi:tripartite-type tricarboxylate transporter receptor subunit TctC